MGPKPTKFDRPSLARYFLVFFILCAVLGWALFLRAEGRRRALEDELARQDALILRRTDTMAQLQEENTALSEARAALEAALMELQSEAQAQEASLDILARLGPYGVYDFVVVATAQGAESDKISASTSDYVGIGLRVFSIEEGAPFEDALGFCLYAPDGRLVDLGAGASANFSCALLPGQDGAYGVLLENAEHASLVRGEYRVFLRIGKAEYYAGAFTAAK